MKEEHAPYTIYLLKKIYAIINRVQLDLINEQLLNNEFQAGANAMKSKIIKELEKTEF